MHQTATQTATLHLLCGKIASGKSTLSARLAARLRARNQAGEHDFAATDQQFDFITRYFVPPTEDEGFKLVVYR